MTDAQKMLALARVVMPHVKWFVMDGKVIGSAMQFDPANNSDQFVAVLAWLLDVSLTHRFEGKDCEAWIDVSGPCVRKMVHHGVRHIPVQTWAHDGTPSGLRTAVTEAGMMVAG